MKLYFCTPAPISYPKGMRSDPIYDINALKFKEKSMGNQADTKKPQDKKGDGKKPMGGGCGSGGCGCG